MNYFFKTFLISAPPVFRRRRDERDAKDDVYFFTKSKKVDKIDTTNMGEDEMPTK